MAQVAGGLRRRRTGLPNHESVSGLPGRPADVLDSLQVKLSGLEVRRPRTFGACWLGCELWHQLGLDEFWQQRLPEAREAVSWEKVLQLGLWPLGVVLVFELLSGFLAIECPIDRDAISVGSPVPGAGFRPENPDLAESALPQTLLGKEADLQFRLIQPTSVYRRVVNGEPIPQRPTLFLAEAVRQRLLGVGTQVVHDQMDRLRRERRWVG